MGAAPARLITHVPEPRCVECGRHINVIYSEALRPRPGEPVACELCGAVATIDAAGYLRAFTEAEFDAIVQDPDAIQALSKSNRAVFLVRRPAKNRRRSAPTDENRL